MVESATVAMQRRQGFQHGRSGRDDIGKTGWVKLVPAFRVRPCTTTTSSTPTATQRVSCNSTTSSLLIGPTRTGQLLEIGVSRADGIDFIIHAMPARPKFIR